MRTISVVAASSLLFLATAFGAGCTVDSSSSSSSSSSGSTSDGGTDTGPIGCLTNGLLKVTVAGLPAGVSAKVKVAGATSTDVTETKDLELATGAYTITAADVATPDTVVRTMYRATVSQANATLCSGPVNVTVTYAAIGSSGKVWTGNANGTATVLGFTPAAVAATSTQPASVASKTRGGEGLAFDKDGNLWTIGGTTADKTIARYSAGSLAVSGEPAPDREIGIANTGCSPLASALAFDKDGNLWVSLLCENKIARLTAAQLAASGDVTPAVEITGITVPKGIAFDKDGNLWASDDQDVKRFNASRLGASIDSSAAPADATLTMPAESEYVAFDKDGNLWSVGGSDINLTRIAKADLAGTGASTPTPAATLSVGVTALPHSIAFDESGGLWVATNNGNFARLAPAQLTTSTTSAGSTVPERTITSDDVGSAGSFALFPAPAALPLYSRAD